MKDVPKFLFVQACKGNVSTFVAADYQNDAVHDTDERLDSTPKTPPKEYIRFDSTFEGFASIRLRNKGAPFIEALCSAIVEKGNATHLRDVVLDAKIKLAKIVAELKSDE